MTLKSITSSLAMWGSLTARFVLVTAIGLAAWAVAPRLVDGWNASTIMSGSMEPLIGKGDVVVWTRDTSGVEIGSVVLYERADGSFVTHRVVGTEEDGRLILRGDANASSDPNSLHPEQLAGVGRILVPLVGRPSLWFDEGNYLALGLLATFVVALAWMTTIERSPRRRVEGPAARIDLFLPAHLTRFHEVPEQRLLADEFLAVLTRGDTPTRTGADS